MGAAEKREKLCAKRGICAQTYFIEYTGYKRESGWIGMEDNGLAGSPTILSNDLLSTCSAYDSGTIVIVRVLPLLRQPATRGQPSRPLSLSLSLYSVYVKERKNVNVFLDANNFRFLFFTVRLKNVPSTVNERRKRGRSVKIVTTERIRLKGREKGKFEIF